jgi:hypothetical protein
LGIPKTKKRREKMKNQIGPYEARFNGVAALLWAMKGRCQKEGRYPSMTEKAKAKILLGELVYLEHKVLVEVANSAKEGRGFRPDLKDNPWRQEFAKYNRYFAS